MVKFVAFLVAAGVFMPGAISHGKSLAPSTVPESQEFDLDIQVPAIKRRPVVGVMGPGKLTTEEHQKVRLLGVRLAQAGFVVLSGGRNAGVMAAVNEGSASAGGFQVGILPSRDTQHASPHLSLAIPTDTGNARNNINTLASDVLIAFKGNSDGTISEIALGRKNGKTVIVLDAPEDAEKFLTKTASGRNTYFVKDVDDAVRLCKEVLNFE